MQEADVIRIVKSTIADKNHGLLASMKSLLDTSLTDLKRSHVDTADSQLKEIHIVLRRKGTRISTSLISKLPTPLLKLKKPVGPNSLTKSTLPSRKVRSFCQRDRNIFCWPISPTLDGH